MNQKKVLYSAIILVCLGIIFTSVYYSLGGFTKTEVYVFEGASRTVIGKHHIGKNNPEKIEEAMLEAKSMIESGSLKGELVLVEFFDDTLSNNSTHYFIGASFDEIRNILELPSGFTYEEFKTDKIYRVFITQHPLVRPLPSDIRSMMEVKAIEDGEVLQPFSFDLYYQDGSLRIESWAN